MYNEDDYGDLTPLSPDDLALIETDYTESDIEDPISEVGYLLYCYFKMKEMDPEIEYEEEMRDYSMAVIRSILSEYDIPTDDLEYLFRFTLEVEVLKKKYGSDEIFGDGHSEEARNALSVRLDEFMKEQPDMFCDVELYDTLFDYKKPYTDTPTYKRVLGMCYEDLMASGTIESLRAMLQLYDEEKPLTEEYIGKAEIPHDTIDEFKEAFDLWVNDKRGGKPIRRRFTELKEIIQQHFASDPELSAWALQQQNNEVAAKYKKTKWIALGICVVIAIFFLVVGIIMLVAWGVLFYTPIGEKLTFIREGKAAVDATKAKQ